MKTLTLRRLMANFGDVQQYHTSAALLETDPGRQALARVQAQRVSAIRDAIRCELAVRDTHSGRTVDDALRANRHLERLLADFLDLGELDGKQRRADKSPDATGVRQRAGNGAPSIPGRNQQGRQGNA